MAIAVAVAVAVALALAIALDRLAVTRGKANSVHVTVSGAACPGS